MIHTPSKMTIKILGCGTSSGVPFIGSRYGACDPNNPKNQRLRSSILIQLDDFNLLIDTSPDLRQQLLRAEISRIDCVLYTHEHADHTHGLNELGTISRFHNQIIPIYGNRPTINYLHKAFEYAFSYPDIYYKPFLKSHIIQNQIFQIPLKSLSQTTAHDLSKINIISFNQDHGSCESLGYRIGDFAYSTDVVNLSDQAFKALKGVKVWVVDCLRYESHTTHSHLNRTLEWIERVGPDRAILTHMGIELDYEILKSQLPCHIEPAFDGMEIII